jgi:hypothetical protein
MRRQASDVSRMACCFGVSDGAETPPTDEPAGMNVIPANASWAVASSLRHATTSKCAAFMSFTLSLSLVKAPSLV